MAGYVDTLKESHKELQERQMTLSDDVDRLKESEQESQQFHGATINMYSCNVIIGDRATIHGEVTCGTSHNLKDQEIWCDGEPLWLRTRS
eukprot:Seg350.14 transcript_id=Seg350.14/GoldUCD/mRNA.D3Y31 product="hypothetical protein" protein_id=Seg350.14/GoldUCD/D3Y31